MKKSLFGSRDLKTLAKRLKLLLSNGLDRRNIEVQLLIQRIKFLIRRLGFSQRRLRRIFGTAIVILGFGFTQNANAQAAFTTPVNNPFGLSNTYQTAVPVQADLDNDGDLDILVAEYYGVFQYFENTGTSSAPAFAAPVQNPFGLTASLAYLPGLSFADLDNDGDLDLMTYEYNTTTYTADIKYYENIGSATVPAFAAPTTNPFGIGPATYFKAPKLVDLDNDGDYDLVTSEYNTSTYLTEFRYQENIGSSTAANFGPSQTSPFGLTFPTNVNAGLVDFNDLDGDGDLDMIFGEFYGNASFGYFENTGSPTSPAFAAPTINPFGLVSTTQMNNPILLDLDNDGDLDILSGEYGGNLVYFENIFSNTGPLTLFNITLGSPSCSPGGDGTVSVTAGGGVGPITYRIGTDSNTTGSFTNYNSGTYTLRVRDSVNTFIDSVITLTMPTPPNYDSLNSFVSNVTCNGANDGFIFLAATGGTQPYSYQLLPSFATPTTNNFYNNLGGNNYTAIITDASNCADSVNITITEPAAIVFNVDSSTNLSCFGASNGAIYTTASGGSGGFSYTISPNAGTQSTPGDFTNLPAGSYTITCTDNNSCSASTVQTITQPANTISIVVSSVNNVTCFGGSDGNFIATATGSTGFTYIVAPNNGTQATPGAFSGLPAASYTITATDANGCTNSIAQNISQPTQLVLSVSSIQDASSATATDGGITSSATGGTGSITYSIAPAGGTQSPPGTFANLGVGNYTITATDANNCTTTSTAMVNFSTSVRDIEKHNISLYPNPVKDELLLKSDIEITSLSILDITGKVLLMNSKPQDGVSLRQLPAGIYVVKLVLKNEETVFARITKQ